jgi:DNA mismatch repair protein MutS
MCGIPYHAATGYISKLIKLGHSVAIAEQLEDPQKTKGMVRRDVVRVMTPGTLVEDELLSAKANNFLVAIVAVEGAKGQGGAARQSLGGHWALAAADVSTGQQWGGDVSNDLHWNTLRAHVAALNPSEILLVGDASQKLSALWQKRPGIRFEPVPSGPADLIGQAREAIRAYLKRDCPEVVVTLGELQPLPTETAGVMFLDETAIRHLELVTSADPGHNGPTLISVLDRCVTPLGGRLLRWWLLRLGLGLRGQQGAEPHLGIACGFFSIVI